MICYLSTKFAFCAVKYEVQGVVTFTELAKSVLKYRGLNILQYEEQTWLTNSGTVMSTGDHFISESSTVLKRLQNIANVAKASRCLQSLLICCKCCKDFKNVGNVSELLKMLQMLQRL